MQPLKATHPRDIPANQVIRQAPRNIEELNDILKPRLCPVLEITDVPIENQRQFEAIIIGEVTAKWADIENVVDDPFMNRDENQEVRRLIAVEFVTQAQKLFMNTLKETEKLFATEYDTKKSTFNLAANLSILRAKLSCKTDEKLSIQRFKGSAVEKVKRARKTILPKESEFPFGPPGSELKELDDINTKPITFKAIKKERQTENANQEKKSNFMQKARTSIFEATSFTNQYEKQLPIERDKQRRKLFRRYAATLQSVDVASFVELDEDKTGNSTELKENFESQKDDDKFMTELDRVRAKTESHLGSLPIISPRKSFENKLKKSAIIAHAGIGTDDDVEWEQTVKKEYYAPYLDDTSTDKDNLEEINLLDPLLQAEIHIGKPRFGKNYIKKPKTPPEPPPENDPNDDLSHRDSPLNSETDCDGSLLYSFSDSSVRIIPEERSEQAKAKLEQMRKMINPAIGIDPIDKSGPIEQPDTIIIQRPGIPFLEASGFKLSDREPLHTLMLEMSPPLFNHLVGDIPPEVAEEMDRKLFIESELEEVYEEISGMMKSDHRNYEDETIVIPAPKPELITLSPAPANNESYSKTRNSINQDLVVSQTPPWGAEGRAEWINNVLYHGHGSNVPRHFNSLKASSIKNTDNKRLSRQKESWLRWWQNTYTSQDYLVWLSQHKTNFLEDIHHLYDVCDGDGEEDKQEKIAKDMNCTSTENILLNTYRHGQKNEPGIWNVTAGASEEDKIEFDRINPVIVKADKTIQDKLNIIWELLKMPDSECYDMAVKFGGQMKAPIAAEALDVWLKAAEAVLKRESIVQELETFEKEFSDPLRFFARGSQSSHSSRLNESNAREKIHKRLKHHSDKVKTLSSRIKKDFNGVVTYEGRDYESKMSRDTVEMLYYIQQERRSEYPGRLPKVTNAELSTLLKHTARQPVGTN